MSRSIVQSKLFTNATSFAMDTAPASGNFLLALWTHWSNNPVGLGNWRTILNLNGTTTDGVIAYYRTVTSVDFQLQNIALGINNEAPGICYEFNGVTSLDVLDWSGEIGVGVHATTVNTSFFVHTPFHTNNANVMLFGIQNGMTVVGTTQIQPTIDPADGHVDDGFILDNFNTDRHAGLIAWHHLYPTSGTIGVHTAVFQTGNQDGADIMVSMQWDAAPPPPSGHAINRKFPTNWDNRFYPTDLNRTFPRA